MLRMIALLTLLVYSVCAFQLEVYNVDSNGNEESSVSSGEMMGRTSHELPGMCWACKWAMRKLKKRISNGATQDDIKNQLTSICDEIGFLKSICRSLVGKYSDMLVEELSTTDNPLTICVNIGVCKKSS